MTDAYAPAFALIAAGQTTAGADRVCAIASQAVVAGRLDEADQALRRAHALVPTHAGVLSRIAGIAHLRGDLVAAQAMLVQALKLDPGDAMAATMRADHLVNEGQAANAGLVAEMALRHAGEAPHLRRALAQAWLYQGRAHDAHVQAMRAANALGNNPSALATGMMTALYDETLAPAALVKLHRELGERFVADPPVAASPAPAAPAAHKPGELNGVSVARRAVAPMPRRARAAGERLRVGFVSADLRAHPMGYFAEPLFAHLPRDAFECFAYARVDRPDAQTATLRRGIEHWRDTQSMSDAATHAAIVADRIDVLVDLGGVTYHARPRLFSGRAAPLQVSWLGYPFTSGLRGIDALVGDARTLPPGSESRYAETLLRLPRTYLGMAPPADAPAVAPSPAAGGAPFTFGSFNHLAKLSDRTVALWSDVLRAVPAARLALSAIALGEQATRDLTQQRFARHGIAADRLLFLPPKPKLADFLAHYATIDVALDPLPFNGGTTTLHALWQGVPTLTLPGESIMNRMGLGIAHAIGLERELVANDAAGFVGRAVGLAQRIDELAHWRRTMRERVAATPLFDPVAFAADFATMLRAAADA